jgi:hypothetical protein
VVLESLARQEHGARIAGGFVLLTTGAGFVAAGLVADQQFDEEWGQAFWITGIVFGATSVFSFALKGPLESLAAETASSSPLELQQTWAEKARSARTARYVGSGVSFALSAGSVIGGAAIAAGAADLDEDEQLGWSAALFLFGGAFASAGVASLMIETDVETGYRAAYGASYDAPSLKLSILPVRGGGGVGLGGSF